MEELVRIDYEWRGRTIKLKRVTVSCAYCGASLLRSTTRAKRPCFCSNSEAMRYWYENNVIDPEKRIEAAHQQMAALDWRRGIPNPAVAGVKSPAKRPESRAKIRAARLQSNWMRGRTGDSHPNWEGGRRSWRGVGWNEIKLRVRQRDGFLCTECDMPEWQQETLFGGSLQVHHKIPYRMSHDNAMDNLQSLCNVCHGNKWTDDHLLFEQVREILAA